MRHSSDLRYRDFFFHEGIHDGQFARHQLNRTMQPIGDHGGASFFL